MARILGFRVQNYRCLRDVSIGFTSTALKSPVLTGLTAVIGKNGTGKSSLLDAFGFLSDCLAIGVEDACNQGQRGGFERLRSAGRTGPIVLEVHYREGTDEPPISYQLQIDLDDVGRPEITAEVLVQRPAASRSAKPVPVLALGHGQGTVWDGTVKLEASGRKSRHLIPVTLTDRQHLGIAAFGSVTAHPRIAKFREFLNGWYLSFFHPNAARGLPVTGPQRHLNTDGSNLGNFVQYMMREDPDGFKATIARIADRIPGIQSIDTHVTKDKRVLLRFNDSGFQDPFYAQQMSDGTLKLLAYMLLLNSPDPPPFICIEEPENGLHHKLLEELVREFRTHADRIGPSSQMFVATHHPYFLDALSPQEVWILDKGNDGFSTARRASDFELVRNMVGEGIPLGSLWYSNYLDPR